MLKFAKLLIGSGVLLLSFATTSYFISKHVAANQEQNQDDFINSTDGNKVVEIRDPLGVKGGGTGFFVKSPSGNSFILTNNHVCGLALDNVLLINSSYYAFVIAHSPDHDLCIVSNPLNISGLKVANDSRNGENIYVVGHPLLEPLSLIKGEISGTLILPIIVGVNTPCNGKNETKIPVDPNSMEAIFGAESLCEHDYEAQATTANILPGNSGSPAVNKNGEVVGVAFAEHQDGPGRGYIIPLSYVKHFLEDK